jgi:hypothetical protein
MAGVFPEAGGNSVCFFQSRFILIPALIIFPSTLPHQVPGVWKMTTEQHILSPGIPGSREVLIQLGWKAVLLGTPVSHSEKSFHQFSMPQRTGKNLFY